MPSICGGSKFVRLGDGQGFSEKFQIFISLMYFITIFFHYVKRKSPRFLQKLSFDKISLKNQNPLFFKRLLGCVHLFYWISYKLSKLSNSIGFFLYSDSKLKR